MKKTLDWKKLAYWIVLWTVLAAGLVFLGLSIFTADPGGRFLRAALCCIFGGNAANLIRIHMERRRGAQGER